VRNKFPGTCFGAINEWKQNRDISNGIKVDGESNILNVVFYFDLKKNKIKKVQVGND
jgi:hypothetical protein